MRHVALEDSGHVERKAEHTAVVFLFLDKLFDSLNGSSLRGTEGKPLTAAMDNKSEHLSFWKESVEILKTFKFICNTSKMSETPPSIKNLIRTIEGIMNIWEMVKKNQNVKFLFTKNFNQDPIGNYFSLIRSHGSRNINPTCMNFMHAHKTLIINNFSARHSLAANCEEDCSEGILSTFEELLDFPASETNKQVVETTYYPSARQYETPAQYGKSTYCAGFILKSLNKINKKCQTCLKDMNSQEPTAQHNLIVTREYDEIRRAILIRSAVVSALG